MRSTLVSLGLGALMVAGAAAGSGGCVGDDVVPASGSPDGGGSGEGGPPARTCTTNADCTGGGVCADGVCCDRACDGVCESCSAPGSEGKCTPVTGAPKHGTCAGDATGPCAGSCDGAKGDACTFPEVACGSGSCAAGTATLPPMCKGGTCGAKVDQACALGCFGETCLGVKSVAAGYSFACAVLTDKKVRCWGDNSSRQVANDATTSYRRPREIPGLTNVQQVAAVFGSVCALLDDKTVKCWGSNSGGQLGNGTTSATPNGVPTLVPGLADATFIGGSSGGHFCAIVTGGAVKCWGGNTSGQIGDGTTAQANAPTLVCAPGSSVGNCVASTGATYVAGGDNHTCAVFAGGQVA